MTPAKILCQGAALKTFNLIIQFAYLVRMDKVLLSGGLLCSYGRVLI